jgi:hypothetical protein
MCEAFPRNPPTNVFTSWYPPAHHPVRSFGIQRRCFPQSNGRLTGLPVSMLSAVVRVNRRVSGSNSVPAKRFVPSAFTMSMSQSRGRRHRTRTRGVGFAFRALLISVAFRAWLKQPGSRKQQGCIQLWIRIDACRGSARASQSCADRFLLATGPLRLYLCPETGVGEAAKPFGRATRHSENGIRSPSGPAARRCQGR